MFKAIALDLDGTLTNSEKKVSERNKKASVDQEYLQNLLLEFDL